MPSKVSLFVLLLASNVGIGLLGFAADLSPTGILIILSAAICISVGIVVLVQRKILLLPLFVGLLVLPGLWPVIPTLAADPGPIRLSILLFAVICMLVGWIGIVIILRRAGLFSKETNNKAQSRI